MRNKDKNEVRGQVETKITIVQGIPWEYLGQVWFTATNVAKHVGMQI